MTVSVFYSDPQGGENCRVFDDWLSAHLFEFELASHDCRNIRIIEDSDTDRYDSLMLDAARLIYNYDLAPMMAIAHALHARGMSSSQTAVVMSELTGRKVRTSVARDYIRRASERLEGDTDGC